MHGCDRWGIRKEFVQQATTACTLLNSVTISNESDETKQLNLVRKLRSQIRKMMGQNKSPVFNKLKTRVANLQKRLLRAIQTKDKPALHFSLSETLRRFNTVTLSSGSLVGDEPIELPFNVTEAITILRETKVSNRCKAQVLFSYYQNRKNLYIQVRNLQRTQHLHRKKEGLLASPILLNPEEKEAIRPLDTHRALKKVLEPIFARKIKALSLDLNNICQSVDFLLPISERAEVIDFLRIWVLHDDPPALQKTTQFLDRYGVVRILLIINKQLPVNETVDRLPTLFEKDFILASRGQAKPIAILRQWYVHFFEFPLAAGLMPDLQALMKLQKSLGENFMANEAKILCCEFLIHLLDPNGVQMAEVQCDQSSNLDRLCKGLGSLHLLLYKHFFLIRQGDPKALLELVHTFERPFLLRAGKLLSRKSIGKEREPISFSGEVLPAMRAGKLSSSSQMAVVNDLFRRSSELFCSISPDVFYNETWAKCPEYLAYSGAANNLGNFAFVKIAEGSTVEERGHTLGQFLLIAQKLVEKGEFLFAIYLHQNKTSTWETRFKEEWKLVREHSKYSRALNWLTEVFDPSHNSKNVKEHEEGMAKEKVIIPFTPNYAKEIEFVRKSNENPYDALVVADRLLRQLFALQYLALTQREQALQTSLVAECIAHTPQSDEKLYAMTTKVSDETL